MKARGVAGSLFAREIGDEREEPEKLAEGAFLLRGFALALEGELRAAVDGIAAAAPFRRMLTPGGRRMSVAMTNCGEFGWITDQRGYRYDALDPDSRRPWPAMPGVFLDLAARAAAAAGYPRFVPDACLINRYEPLARMSLHQDRDEKDFAAPIVSVSLGLPAVFLFGGHERSQRPRRISLFHGDVAVWGGPSRLAFHGIAPLKEGEHEIMGRRRINLTLRRAR
jgi:alkylated DNA repair protein (DNA oxidative demethylase)